jgi:uncharacterized membrane protein YkoI
MKKLVILSALFLALILSACSENSVAPVGNTSVDEQFVLQKTKSMVLGSSYKVNLMDKDYPKVQWEVIVEMPNGALVKYHYFSDGNIREIEGLTGPFEYELKVGDGYVAYSYARKSALKGVDGKIYNWKFGQDESEGRTLQFRFFIEKDGKKFEVRLNGVTGDIIRIKD